jgi:hypothetical protein
MLEGLKEEEANIFLQENPTLASLSYRYSTNADAPIVELGKAKEALE